MSSDTPINFASLDTAVHGPVRLGVLTALAADEALDFSSLKHRLGVADGALGTHLQKLEAVGYIKASKRFVGKRPNTLYQLTAAGRGALFAYLETMQRLIDFLRVSPAVPTASTDRSTLSHES